MERHLSQNLFGNCRQPAEVVPFFRSEWNSGNSLTICENRFVSWPFSQDRVANDRRHSHPVGH